MAVNSATASNSAALQLGLQQLKVQQAKRNAEQAEAVASALQSQAQAAQREVERAEGNARDVGARSDLAQDAAGRARQGIAALQSQSAMRARVGTVADNTVGRISASSAEVDVRAAAPPVKVTTAEATASPVVNTSGQVTGRLVSVTA